jgi:hypothetical protein
MLSRPYVQRYWLVRCIRTEGLYFGKVINVKDTEEAISIVARLRTIRRIGSQVTAANGSASGLAPNDAFRHQERHDAGGGVRVDGSR